MKNPVGYLTNRPDGLYGERGMFYDYILAGNGVFIEAEGKLMAARVPVALCEIRGLATTKPKVVLRHGKIPEHLWNLALNTVLTTPDKERFVAVTFTDTYHLSLPLQAADKEELKEVVTGGHGSGAAVSYLNPDSVLLDLHTHPKMQARFSPIDNRDDAGLKLYGVIGHCGTYHEITDDMSDDEVSGWLQNNCPAVRFRAGVYGYFHDIAWEDVFVGDLGHEYIDIGKEEQGISRGLLEEALAEPRLPESLRGDIEDELHRRAE